MCLCGKKIEWFLNGQRNVQLSNVKKIYFIHQTFVSFTSAPIVAT